MLDRIDEIVPGERATAIKGVTLAEDYFEDHFPKFPVVPGVLVVEALAQLSGKLIELTVWQDRDFWPFPVLSMVRNAKFRKFIRPGSQIRLEATLAEIREESAVTKCKALVDGKVTTDVERRPSHDRRRFHVGAKRGVRAHFAAPSRERAR